MAGKKKNRNLAILRRRLQRQLAEARSHSQKEEEEEEEEEETIVEGRLFHPSEESLQGSKCGNHEDVGKHQGLF
jgi:hypothetical protein